MDSTPTLPTQIMEPYTVPLESTTRSVPSSLRKADRSGSVEAIHLSEYDNQTFDRGCGRLKEACWFFVRCVFFMTAWFRCHLLRLFGARIGQGVIIRSRVNITFPWRLALGNHVWLGEEVNLHSLAPIVIEDHVCLSQRAFLCTGSHDFRSAGFDLKTGPITIAPHSWIAANVFVGPNVHLGPHAMVTAGSVVTRSLPAASILSGNPAEVRERLKVW